MSQERPPQWIEKLVEKNRPDTDTRVYVPVDNVFMAIAQTAHHMFHTSIEFPIEQDTTPEEAYKRFCDIITDRFNKEELNKVGESQAIVHTEVLSTKVED